MKSGGSWSVAELAELIGGSVSGNGSARVRGAATLMDAREDDVSFLSKRQYLKAALDSRAGCVILDDRFQLLGRTTIVVENAHRGFTLAMRALFPEERPVAGVSRWACVEDDAELGEDVYVGPQAYVGSRVKLGTGVVVYAGAIVHEECSVGEGTVLHSGTVLHRGVVLGRRVVVRSNAVLGGQGFGFDLSEREPLRMPQVGRIVVGDDVEVGACSVIDRAALGETRIGPRSKIDAHVYVGHNVFIGEDSVVIGQSGIAGSARIGDGCVIMGQVGIRGHVSIGDNAKVLAGSGVVGNVAEGETVAGFPASPALSWKRKMSALSKLPELLRRVRKLEKVNPGK